MENYLIYRRSADYFEEAMPLGNGSLGAMVYGKTDVERITINHDTLWSGKPGDNHIEGSYESNERAKKLVLEGKIKEAQEELEKNFTGYWLASYLLLGNLYFETIYPCGCQVSDYKRVLDLEKSMHTVTYKKGSAEYKREYLVSHPDNCMMIRLTSTVPVSYRFFGDALGQEGKVSTEGDMLRFYGECPSIIKPSYTGEKEQLYDGTGIKVNAMLKPVTDGEITANGKELFVKNAKELTLYFVAETSFVSFDKAPNKETYKPCLERISQLSKKTYEEIKKDHIEDVSALYNRVKIDLCGEKTDKDTDERLKEENKDTGLCELLFNFGRYIIIASSRNGSRSTNLQGIWNDSMYPAWSSNYTLNINAEMNYWPVLMCNLPDCYQPILDLIEGIYKNGKETAKRLYNAEGFVSHHNSDLWAHTTPVGSKVKNSTQYAYWNMSSGWLMHHLYEYYEYTGDKEFLSKAYEIMAESARFYLSYMTEYNGKLVVFPSTSPENSYLINNELCYLAPYTTMSQAIVEEVFINLLASAKVLGISDELTKEVEAKLPLVRTYEIGSHGELLEYDKEYEEFDIEHRHVSHLYGLYPAGQITTESEPELAAACRRTLERRGDEGTGWSMGWKVNLWAKLKNGEKAMKLVKNQLKFMPAVIPEGHDVWHGGGTYANMFDAHPPFQIDGNFGVCAGIAQMLLQCEDGKIKILPALPSEMSKGSVSGLLAKGNVTVDIEWENSRATKVKLVTPISQTAIININGSDISVSLNPNEEFVLA